jgi:DKNYY family
MAVRMHPAAPFAASWIALAAALVAGCGKSEPDFALKDGVWHYRTASIPQADAASFTVLDDHYAKDRQRVYWGDSYRKGQEYYSIRHDRVKVIEGADAPSFRLMPYDYARDAASLYYEGRRIAVKDLATFEPMDDGFARDRLSGYYYQNQIAGSDGETFARLDSHHARDKSRVFFCGIDYTTSQSICRPLQGADPAQVQLLDTGYAKTATTVFYRGQRVTGADAASFETPGGLPDGADAKDKNGNYDQGRKAKPPAPGP